jgi:hypothetical protein
VFMVLEPLHRFLSLIKIKRENHYFFNYNIYNEHRYQHDEQAALIRVCNREYESLLDLAKFGTKELIESVEKLHQDRRVLADLMPKGLDRQCLVCFSTVKRCSIM